MSNYKVLALQANVNQIHNSIVKKSHKHKHNHDHSHNHNHNNNNQKEEIIRSKKDFKLKDSSFMIEENKNKQTSSNLIFTLFIFH